MKKLDIEQLEQHLKNLIEVYLTQYLPGEKDEALAAHQLANAVYTNMQEKEGILYAPNVYTLVAHPSLIQKWQNDERLTTSFLQLLDTIAKEAQFTFAAPPALLLTADSSLAQGVVHVIASHRTEPLSQTQDMPAAHDETNKAESENIPENAFLIVHGTKVFPLDKPIVNIGRRMNNQLVLDDPRVSRSHAQLRAIKGSFVIFDLNSTGGTFVNGQRVTQSVLYPGDVISLAGVPLIFGQDNPPQRPDLAETSPFAPSSSDRPTAIFRRTKKP
jgi:hypothetical protein